MDAMLMMLAAFAGYIIMYRLYGRYIGSKIFALAAKNPVPAVEMEDGVDYVPTKKEIIFGHHFTVHRRHRSHCRSGHRGHLGPGSRQ